MKQLLKALLVLMASHNSLAETTPAPPENEPANYAFATYMGSGLYGATDSSLFLINVPTHFELKKYDDVRIRLSVSAGFYDYNRDNVEDFELPDHVGTLTVIPGIEKTYRIHTDFEVIPHLDYGYAKNFSTKEEAQVYSVGVHSRYFTRGKHDDHVWYNSFLFAGYRTFSGGVRDNYVKLLTGYDYKIPYYKPFFDHKLVPTVYGHLSWSHNGIDYFDKWQSSTKKDLTTEIGFTLYTPVPFDLWITEVKRVGVGLQHGPVGKVVRIFIGSPFE